MLDPRSVICIPKTVLGVIDRTPDIRGHVPARPSWLCADADCRDRWPCVWARVMLGAAAGRDRVGLSVLMAQVLHVAVRDLVEVADPHDLYGRMVEWTR